MDKKDFKSFPAAMMDYFGKRGTNLDFMNELKQLTDADKAELREMLKEAGYTGL